MKTKLFSIAVFAVLMANQLLAQDVTTVNAKNSDISDNLDLRAVASIFGQSSNLEDFERRLNNPKEQISNLDLNKDGNVDYLRVIESVERNTHLIIIQSVLGRDVFQDVATVEVQKDANNQVQVQVVGDVFMYGQNYIYEPIYIARPLIYSTFWIGNYNPYYSPYYWNYYPGYFSYWNPYPVFRYRRNVNIFINYDNSYNYVNNRRCQDSYYNYSSRRANGYEARNPNRSFSQRNGNISNRYELDRTRNVATTRGESNNNSRNINGNSRGDIKENNTGRTGGTRVNSDQNLNTRSATRAESQVSNNSNSTSNNTSRPVQNGADVNTRNTTREIENANLPVRNTNQDRNSSRNNSPAREAQSSRSPNVQPNSSGGSRKESSPNQQRSEGSNSGGRRG